MEIFIFVIITIIVSDTFKSILFKSQFGKDALRYPRDVKLNGEYIFVLDASNLCLHLFAYNHIQQKSVISRRTGLEVIYACNFVH